jgi:hypothetical protein
VSPSEMRKKEKYLQWSQIIEDKAIANGFSGK